MAILPFSTGQSMSTFLICSQRSIWVQMRRIRPYLTCSRTYAPSNIGAETSPIASMIRSVPLRLHLGQSPGSL